MRSAAKPRANDRASSAILLVEDNDDDILLLKRAFRNAHVANPLNVVKDGEEAIRYFASAGAFADRARCPLPFLMLLDLRLPKLSGFEVLAWVREQPDLKELVVVVLTNSDHVPDAAKARELGANAYLVKPGNFAELVTMVKRIKGRWLTLEQPAEPSVIKAPRSEDQFRKSV